MSFVRPKTNCLDKLFVRMNNQKFHNEKRKISIIHTGNI